MRLLNMHDDAQTDVVIREPFEYPADDGGIITKKRKVNIDVEMSKMSKYLRTGKVIRGKKRSCTDHTIANQFKCCQAAANMMGCFEFTQEWIDSLYDYMMANEYPANTMKNYLNSVENLFNGNDHPISISKPMPIDDSATQDCLTKSQVMKIIDTTGTNKRDRAMLWLMWGSAIRANECSFMHVDDLTIVDGHGSVKVVDHGNGIKGKQSRNIPLDAECTGEMRRWLAFRQSHDMTTEKFPYMFMNTINGGRISYMTIYKNVHYYANKAGIPCHPHSFRHARCSWLLNEAKPRVPPTIVQRIMGHNSIETTMRYNHTTDEQVANFIYNLV